MKLRAGYELPCHRPVSKTKKSEKEEESSGEADGVKMITYGGEKTDSEEENPPNGDEMMEDGGNPPKS